MQRTSSPLYSMMVAAESISGILVRLTNLEGLMTSFNSTYVLLAMFVHFADLLNRLAKVRKD